jgi:hypothetical protein
VDDVDGVKKKVIWLKGFSLARTVHVDVQLNLSGEARLPVRFGGVVDEQS